MFRRGRGDAGRRTIGILPGEDLAAANRFVDTLIVTEMGNAGNVMVVMNGDATIAVSGSTGTLSELGHAVDVVVEAAGGR